ncbi:purple acid phosphatase family protein [Flavilitoribacter nigricans]|uniref:Ig-like domain-containing protein n=1 Tax=Flavilitoribacter nigricans (strain ATCC 23147 / DSM 23189 / NBRC 102662 / NCIMB 1420 / SS-2) TaxID=1122177 RepID=A0A2D0NGY0_FLAN2|nr:metallophosphoesterase family protein [Flavilitoribacter nigricans]PHN07429.1 hypothetical protein CRP01_07315 [Flavilitoribacter nigricans DSM 23189 = NBRC 102662]
MHRRQILRSGWIIFFLFLLQLSLWSKTARYRCMWREEPSTTMVIGWDQVSGYNAEIKYDVVDHGTDARSYRYSAKPAAKVSAKGMNNHFARLTHLNPNTTYYFVIQDTEGVSKRMSFRTTPDNPNLKLSIIAGGDSRNHRKARISGNRIVGKLRPHFVMFGGDMTAGDTPTEWVEWLDDWQHTITSDGRLTPIVVARGNHEASNTSLVEIFDVAKPSLYYALTFGGNLVRIYTLNTLIPSGGDQRTWLEKDLAANQSVSWRMAQYHHTIRPHTRSKPERDELLLNWSTLFNKYKLRLVVESDAHVVKWTYPIKPSRAPGSQMGFIRDDVDGTVYVGEGCWGAPLRSNNDDKSWTRNSGSFNQFKWIFVDRRKIEVRTVIIDGSSGVEDTDVNNVFDMPRGLSLWNPSNGSVVTIVNDNVATSEPEPPMIAGPPMEILDCTAKQNGDDIIISWTVSNDALGMNYEVQRSVDGGSKFTTIADYRAKKTGTATYHCPDLNVARRYKLKDLKYRLSYEDKQGGRQWQEPKIQISTAAAPPAGNSTDASGLPPIIPLNISDKGTVKVAYNLQRPGAVEVILMTPELREVSRLNFPGQSTGAASQTIDISRVPRGQYLLVVKGEGKVIRRFRVVR